MKKTKKYAALLPGPTRKNRFEPFEELLDAGERELLSLDPGWAKAALFFRTGHRLGHKPDSVRAQSLLEVHRLIGVYRRRFASGDTLALLHAVSLCGEENLPLPSWLAESLHAALSAFLQPSGPSSLDDVFYSRSLPTETAKKAAAAKQDWQLGVRLWRDLWQLVREDETIVSLDAAITRLLGLQPYGVGKTKAKAIIALVERSQLEFLQNGTALSRFLRKRRLGVT